MHIEKKLPNEVPHDSIFMLSTQHQRDKIGQIENCKKREMQ